MRSRFKEVNVKQKVKVPSRGWLANIYLWACERLYYEFAWAYDLVSWVVSASHWRRWQALVWRYIGGKKILEVGCGTGAIVLQGEHLGYTMTGVDRSPAMVALAQRRLRRS